MGLLGASFALLVGPAAAQPNRPLRIVLGQELAILDPIISTNNATRQFGYMVFDTLIAVDSQGRYRPQMLEGWTVSDDGRRYRFTLREGLEWHDGQPVTAADCVASIRRWGARDGLGQLLLAATARLEAEDARSFVLELERPFGFVIEALGKPGTIVPFMMPARIAATGPPRGGSSRTTTTSTGTGCGGPTTTRGAASGTAASRRWAPLGEVSTTQS